VVASCERGNGPLGAIKDREFINMDLVMEVIS